MTGKDVPHRAAVTEVCTSATVASLLKTHVRTALD
jgi:hypothetical protein